MILRPTRADLTGIEKDYAIKLKNEIIKITDGKLHFNNEYPALKELYELLNGMFETTTSGVNFIQKRN
jgi:hypothetical protein